MLSGLLILADVCNGAVEVLPEGLNTGLVLLTRHFIVLLASAVGIVINVGRELFLRQILCDTVNVVLLAI